MTQRGTFYTVEKIGPNREKTPEGFLLCKNVPIARTGMMIYGPDETPVKGGPDGITRIFRDDKEVFRPETIASGNGKSVCDTHPEDDVLPATWKELTIGTMFNVRRGEGNEDDLLLADLLITDAVGIALVEAGKAEVSLGYDADYVEVEPGIGRQENIYINHVAVVDEGRCGPRCAIRDHKTINLDDDMSKTRDAKTAVKTATVRDKLSEFFTKAFKAKDAAEVEKLVEDAAAEMEEGASTGDTHVHVHAADGDDEERWKQNDAEHAELRERIAALEAHIAGKGGAKDGKGKDTGEGNPNPDKNTQGKQGHNPGTLDESAEEKEKREKEEADKKAKDAKDEETRADEMALDEVPEDLKEEVQKNKDKARDSAFMQDTVRDVFSMGEILAPGISFPTFDAAARPGATAKTLCSFRRKALDSAYTFPETRTLIDTILAGKRLDTSKMTCDAARTLFNSAAAMKQQQNNGKAATRATNDASHQHAQGVVTLADLNRKNAEHWAAKH